VPQSARPGNPCYSATSCEYRANAARRVVYEAFCFDPAVYRIETALEAAFGPAFY
jgi:hypothetical protein